VRAGLTAIALAALSTGVRVAADPSSTTSDVIAVATNADGGRDTEIALVTSEGRVLRFLTQNGLVEFDPSWSQDRRRIAFARVGARRGGIHLIAVAGRSVRRLTRGTDTAPAFSPDGRQIAFVRGSSIRVIGADARGERRLVGTRWPPRQLSWSPDGRSILFADDGYVRLLDVAGRRVTTIPVGGQDSNFRPLFAPDGRRIAFLGSATSASTATRRPGASFWQTRTAATSARSTPASTGRRHGRPTAHVSPSSTGTRSRLWTIPRAAGRRYSVGAGTTTLPSGCSPAS
jgi:Tol biopolymer transport system component